MPLYLGKELEPCTEISLSVQNRPTGDYLKWRGGPILAQTWDDGSGTNHGWRLTPVTGDNYTWIDVDGPGGGFYHHFYSVIGDRANQLWCGISSDGGGASAGLRMQAIGSGVLVPITFSSDKQGGQAVVFIAGKQDGASDSGLWFSPTTPHKWGDYTGTNSEFSMWLNYRAADGSIMRMQPVVAGQNRDIGLDLVPSGTSTIAALALYGSGTAKRASRSMFKTGGASFAFGSALFDAAALTDNAVVWVQPANSILLSFTMVCDVAFVSSEGAALTDLDIWVGNAGDNDGLLVQAMNLKTDGAGGQGYITKGAYWNGATTPIYYVAANTNWTAYATAVGANLSTLTAGQVSFYASYIQFS